VSLRSNASGARRFYDLPTACELVAQYARSAITTANPDRAKFAAVLRSKLLISVPDDWGPRAIRANSYVYILSLSNGCTVGG
jgi:hypothetical protein